MSTKLFKIAHRQVRCKQNEKRAAKCAAKQVETLKEGTKANLPDGSEKVEGVEESEG